MSYDLKLRVPSGVAAHLSFAPEKDRKEDAPVNSTPPSDFRGKFKLGLNQLSWSKYVERTKMVCTGNL